MSKPYRYLLAVARLAARFPFLQAIVVRCYSWWHSGGRAVAAGAHLCLHGLDDASSHVLSLRADGYSAGLWLDTSFVETLKQKFFAQTLTEDKSGNRVSAAQAIESGSSAAFRWRNPHNDDAQINALAHDERLIKIATNYLGCSPILHSTQIWLLNPPTSSGETSAEYGWHYDIDDFRFLKVFFYLTDTGEVNGQHMLVGTSHRDLRPHKLINRRITDKELRARYAMNNIHKMEGAAGQGFLEDTWLYHKATPPSGQRVMMQLEYCATGVMKSLERHI